MTEHVEPASFVASVMDDGLCTRCETRPADKDADDGLCRQCHDTAGEADDALAAEGFWA